ncbi:putative fibronectin type iii domain-containing protein [Phaeoacremonium minimum UCRPA7]|uniref:Putative fibronectin type iii domain-containing protein n=1 Tax=Phaeoacremonium minimum (strain UCR-PA7) TaxID=1286976 RepID=R8BCR6_PHAM7|nr:putative fibronectin type iii domain-containing protein [Phaeoacremonium minimum UCRPA7]EON97086.1 putative fibronectin type iii domain-containing protein [Phaeoacremonium minimum UCRPA7]
MAEGNHNYDSETKSSRLPALKLDYNPTVDHLMNCPITVGHDNPGGDRNSDKAAIRVMIVGDSISHGAEGDYTWRYRIWQWFQAEGIPTKFVGPYKGTQPPNKPSRPQRPFAAGGKACTAIPATDGGYAMDIPEDWDSNHFSVWGRQAAQTRDLIEAEVAKYHPDLLLVELGFNDMGWFVSGPEGTLQSMSEVIHNARKSNSHINIALANVPHRTYISGRDDLVANTRKYNSMLSEIIPSWSRGDSLVHLVRLQENYGCGTDDCPAGHDGLHPNALGEFQIAQAFSRTLVNDFKIGARELGVPLIVPQRPTPVPDNIQVVSAPGGIIVTWDAVYGAYSYDLRSRIVGTEWSKTPIAVNRFDNNWVSDGMEWEYQVRTNNGEHVGISDWTQVKSAVAHPETAPGPSNTIVTATSDGIRVTWQKPTGPYTDSIEGYELFVRSVVAPGTYIKSKWETGCRAEFQGLERGQHYVIAIASWNTAGCGIPSHTWPATPGHGRPTAPLNLQAQNVDPTTVQLTWDNGSVAAAGYRVWVRQVSDGAEWQADRDDIIMNSSHGVAFLFPGTWNFEFCVTAVNGHLESGKSNHVIPLRWLGHC